MGHKYLQNKPSWVNIPHFLSEWGSKGPYFDLLFHIGIDVTYFYNAISHYTSLNMSYYVSIDPGLHFKYTIFWKSVDGGAVAAFETCDRGGDIDDRGGGTPHFFTPKLPQNIEILLF